MSQLTGLTRVSTLQRWIHIICTRSGIRVQYEDDIPTAYATEDSVVIPRLTGTVTEDDEAVLRWQVVHEVIGHHNLGPEVFKILKEEKLPMSSPLGPILNIIEDQRIEYGASQGYAGDAAVISNGREVSGRRTLEYMDDLVGKLPPDGLEAGTAKMQALYLAALLSQAEWCPGAAYHIHDEVSLTTGHFVDVRSNLLKLVKSGFANDMRKLDNEYDSWALAKKVYALLWDKTEQEVEQECADNRAAKGNGKDEKGEGSKGEGAGGDLLDENGKPMEGIDPRTGKYRIPFKYFVKSVHEEEPDATYGHGLGLDYTNHTEVERFDPIPFEQFEVTDYRAHPPTRKDRLVMFGGSRSSMSASSAFSNRMRKYLQVKAEDTYEGGQRKGILNSRALFRVGLPKVGDGDWNRKVFRTKQTSDMLDTSVTLLSDNSGSMSGIKVVHSTQAVMLLNHVISNVLKVDTEILTFTHAGRTPKIGVIKAFGERASDDTIYERMDDAAHLMLGNSDADAILYAHDRLTRQTTKRKVLIVLSDGSPADGAYETDPAFALRTTVKEIHEAKKVSIVGIGIMDNSVTRFYPEHTIIQRADELEDCLIKVISNQILKTGN